MQDGQWRVTPSRTLEYRLLPSELREQAAAPSLDVVVPHLKWLVNINGTSDVSLQSLSFAHTEWELQTKVRGSWRDRIESPPPADAPADLGAKLVLNQVALVLSLWRAG